MPHLIRIDWPHNGIPDLPPRAASTAAVSSLAAIRARIARIAGVVVALAIVFGPMADNGSIVQRQHHCAAPPVARASSPAIRSRCVARAMNKGRRRSSMQTSGMGQSVKITRCDLSGGYRQAAPT